MRLHQRAASCAGVLSLVLLAGCSTGEEAKPGPSTAQTTSPSTASATPTPVVATAAPAHRACYALTREQALAAEMPTTAVPCAKPHTAQTYRVGEFDLMRDGHLLAIDSQAANQQVATECSRALTTWLGGDPRLTVLTPNWYSATLEQADAGANWYRCDVVALNGATKLATLPAATKNLLATEAGRNQYALCRTSAPNAANSSPVPCSAKHAYRATRAVDLPGTDLPTKEAGAAAMDTPCQDAATTAAADPLNVKWVQELPTEAQWAAGRRYGICWVPA